jgi:hypothetical protein
VRPFIAVKRLIPKIASIIALLTLASALALSSSWSAGPAWAGDHRGGSSYSRPGGGGSSYSRPSTSGGSSSQGGKSYISPHRPFSSPSSAKKQSAGDLAQSRAASGKSLRDYKDEKEYANQFKRQSSAPQPASGSWGSVPRQSYDSWSSQRTTYYGGHGWSAPVYVYHSQPRFGMWDAMWMWFMLDTLTRPGHGAFFYNHANDPGYQEWRREADRLAKDNADLRAKLNALDADVKTHEGKPRDPNYIPPDGNRQVALSSAHVVQPSSSFPWGIVISLLLLAGVGTAAYMYSRRTRGEPVGTISNYVQSKFSGSGNGNDGKSRQFRVGMVVSVDEAPFILAGDKLNAAKPGAAGDSNVSAEAIGRLGEGATALTRIYVDSGGFFQIHLDRGGQPDECRWFSTFDEFTPAGSGDDTDRGDTWAFWLDDDDGQVGWPAFQTPDGVQYERAWAPGSRRTPPVIFSEELTDSRGTRKVMHQMMLYQRPTGLDTPAPDAEYALLDVVEDGEEASVRIYMGVDINPASLSLA